MDPLALGLAAGIVVAIAAGFLRARGLNEQVSRLRGELESERERLVRLGLHSEDTERDGMDSQFDEYDLE